MLVGTGAERVLVCRDAGGHGDNPRLAYDDVASALGRLDVPGQQLAVLNRSGEHRSVSHVQLEIHVPIGRPGRKQQDLVAAPLIVRWPGGAKAGLAPSELVSTIDILPTVMQAVGMESVAAELPGRALQPLLTGAPSPEWRRYVFGFTTGAFPRACFVQHSVRDQRFKLISSPRPGTENLDAGTYLDERHQHFVISGATAEEQAAAPQLVRAAFDRWSRPPRYELYDLSRDPCEWRNLADDPRYAEVKTRLITALGDWQERTRDPFLDQANVDAFVEEQLANRDLLYRKNKSFRWSYLDTFPKWRDD